MAYYVAANLDSHVYCVLGDWGEVIELGASGVRLLNEFVDVIGCNKSLEVSVFDAVIDELPFEHEFNAKSSYSLVEALGDNAYSVTGQQVLDMLNQGYYLPGDTSIGFYPQFSNYNPSIAMRYGIKASVTDKGRLLRLHAENKECVVLGEFCRALSHMCICYNPTTVFVFDDRIISTPFEFYNPMSRVTPLKVDTHAVKNNALRSDLDALISTGYVKEMSYRR